MDNAKPMTKRIATHWDHLEREIFFFEEMDSLAVIVQMWLVTDATRDHSLAVTMFVSNVPDFAHHCTPA